MATRNFAVSKDAMYRGSDGTWFGSDASNVAGAIPANGDWTAIMSFSQSFAGVYAINSATLHIRLIDEIGGTQSLNIRRCTEMWWEASGPIPNTTTTSQIDTTISATIGWKSIDITELMNDWAPASVLDSHGVPGANSPNHGIRISNSGASSDSAAFASRESSYDAYITLDYDDNVVPLAPTLLKVNALLTGQTIVGSTDPIVTFTHSDPNADAISQYQIDIDATTAAAVQPNWTGLAYSATVAAGDGSISGNNVTKTITGLAATWTRGSWYAVRARTNDGLGWGPYSYLWFRVNSLPTVSLTEPSATGRLAKLSYTPGSGWSSPRLNVAWSYADAQAQTQTKYTLEIANDSAGSPGGNIVSGDVTSGVASVVAAVTITESSYYHVRVRVFDGLEWSAYTSWLRVRARWGLTTHKKDVSISGGVPTSWNVTSIATTTGASSSVSIEYSSDDNGAGANLGAYQASLSSVTKRKWVYYRAWLLSWGASPATSPSLDSIVIQASGLAAQPDYWLPSPISTNGGSIELSTHAFGSQSLRIGGNGTSRVVSQVMPCDPNTDYVLQARIKSIGNSNAYVSWWDGAVNRVIVGQVAADTDWTMYSSEPFNSGENTSITLHCVVSGAAGTAGFFDGIKIERGQVSSPWVPGFVGDAVVLDAGGVQIDASAGGVLRLRASTGGARDRVDLGLHGLEFGGDIELYSPAAKRMLIGDTSIDMGGTAFPASPGTYDRYYRQDIGLEFVWNGTRWLSTQVFMVSQQIHNQIAATTIGRGPAPDAQGATDYWVEEVVTSFNVVGGTALGASHKWVGTLAKQPAGTTVATITINSGAVSTWRRDVTSVNALLTATNFAFDGTWTKTGTPGALIAYMDIFYRVVAT